MIMATPIQLGSKIRIAFLRASPVFVKEIQGLDLAWMGEGKGHIFLEAYLYGAYMINNSSRFKGALRVL